MGYVFMFFLLLNSYRELYTFFARCQGTENVIIIPKAPTPIIRETKKSANKNPESSKRSLIQLIKSTRISPSSTVTASQITKATSLGTIDKTLLNSP